MASFFMRALSWQTQKSERSKRRMIDIKLALDELHSNLETISIFVKENHGVKVAVDRVFDTSPPSAQVFLKSPKRENLLLNEETIFKLFAALSDQDMPVAALIFDLAKQHGFDSVSDIVLNYMELISPLLHTKHLPEESYNLFTAIEDAWHIGNLFEDGNSAKAYRSQRVSPLRTKHFEDLEYGNSPKVVQYISHLLHKRSAIQQQPVNFQGSDTKNSTSAIIQTNNFCNDSKENAELSKSHLHSSERTFVLSPEASEEDEAIKRDAHKKNPDANPNLHPKAKEQQLSLASSHESAEKKTSIGLTSIDQTCANSSTPDEVVTISEAAISVEQKVSSSNAHEGKNESSVKVLADVTGDDKKQVADVCDSISSPYKLLDMEEEASLQKEKTFANFPRSWVGLINNDGGGQITADCDSTSKAPHKLSQIRKGASHHYISPKTPAFNRVPTSESALISFPCHSRHLSFAEGENKSHGAHLRRGVNYTGSASHSFNNVESDKFVQSARFRRIGFSGSEGHSFSVYTTDSEDEALSMSTEVSLLVAASETQQLDIDPDELSSIWAASINFPDTGICRGSIQNEGSRNFYDKQHVDMNGCEETDPGHYNEGTGESSKGLSPWEANDDVNIKSSYLADQSEADLQCIPAAMSVSALPSSWNSDSGKLVYPNDSERSVNKCSSQFSSCSKSLSDNNLMKSSERWLLQHDEDLTQKTTIHCSTDDINHIAEMVSLQHDAELTKDTAIDCLSDGMNHIIDDLEADSMQGDLLPSVLKSIPPDSSYDELSADGNERIAYPEVDKVASSVQSVMNLYKGKSISSKSFTKGSDLRGISQGGENNIMQDDVGELPPDCSEVTFSVAVAENGAPAHTDEVAVGSLYNLTKIPCETHHKQGIITFGGCCLPDSEVREVEEGIPPYTCEETKPLDKFEVFGENKPNVLDQSILDESVEIISGQDNYMIASQTPRCLLQHLQHSRSVDQKDFVGEGFFRGKFEHGKCVIYYAEEQNADSVDFLSREEQKHIIEDSKGVVHENKQHEKVFETDVAYQEPMKVFTETEQLDFAKNLIENGTMHLYPEKNSYLEDLAKLGIEHNIVYGSNSKLQGDDYNAKAYYEFQDPLNARNLSNCKLVSALLDHACTELATHNLQSSRWSLKESEDYLIKFMETQKHHSTIIAHEGNLPIDDTKNECATVEGVASNILADEKPRLHTSTVSTDGKVSCFVPSTTNLISEPGKHLSKSPPSLCISDQASMCQGTNDIANVPISGSTGYSYASVLCLFRSYCHKKLERSSFALNCLSWNASSPGIKWTKRKNTIHKHKRQWLLCCLCCSQQATHS